MCLWSPSERRRRGKQETRSTRIFTLVVLHSFIASAALCRSTCTLAACKQTGMGRCTGRCIYWFCASSFSAGCSPTHLTVKRRILVAEVRNEHKKSLFQPRRPVCIMFQGPFIFREKQTGLLNGDAPTSDGAQQGYSLKKSLHLRVQMRPPAQDQGVVLRTLRQLRQYIFHACLVGSFQRKCCPKHWPTAIPTYA